jgi:hypothetical protein
MARVGLESWSGGNSCISLHLSHILLTVVRELLLLGHQDQSHPLTPHHNYAAEEVTDAARKSITQTMHGNLDGCLSHSNLHFFFETCSVNCGV